jgi:hypothetical protein
MTDELTAALVVFLSCAVVALMLAVQRLRFTGWNVIDPVATFGIGFSVFYGMSNACYCLALMNDASDLRGGWQFDPRSTEGKFLILRVAVMTAVFGVSFVVGALLVGACLERRFDAGISRAKLDGVSSKMACLMLTPLALWGWATSFGMVPSLNGIAPTPIVMMPAIGVLGLLITLCYQAATRRTLANAMLAIAALGLSCVLALPSAMKEGVLSPVLAGLAGVVMASRSWRPIAAAAILGVPGVLVLNFWTHTNRQDVWTAVSGLPSAGRFEYALTVGLGDGLSVEALTRSAEGLIHRLCTLIPMAETVLMIDRNDSISMADGLIVPLTPRALWPDKPAVDIGERLYHSFSGNYGSSNSPNLPAETYMYGGWMGILIAGVALGFSAGLLGHCASRFWERRVFFGLAVMIPAALLYGKCENWLHQYPVLLISLAPLLVLIEVLSNRKLRGKLHGPVIATSTSSASTITPIRYSPLTGN